MAAMRRIRRMHHHRGIDLSLDAELEVRLGRGTPATRMAVLSLDGHPYKLPKYDIAHAVSVAEQGDRAAAHRLLEQAREHVARMRRRAT